MGKRSEGKTKRPWSGVPRTGGGLAAGLFLALFLVAAPGSALNLITNGSFDAAGTQVGGFAQACSQSSSSANCPFLPGWNVQILSNNAQIDCVVPGSARGNVQNPGAPDLICTPGNPPSTQVTGGAYKFTLWSAPGPSPDAANYFLADGGTPFSGTLSQNVSGLNVGSLYNLTFWQASAQEDCLYDDGANCDPIPAANLTQWWQVTFGSTTLTSTVMSTPIHTSVAWNKVTLTFLASATSELLTFYARGTPDIGPPIVLLDGVTLVEAPEVETSALLGIGLGCMILGRVLRKRRKRNPGAPSSGPPPE